MNLNNCPRERMVHTRIETYTYTLCKEVIVLWGRGRSICSLPKKPPLELFTILIYVPVEKMMPNKTPNALIDTMSSRLDAAITIVFTPFSPYPKRFNRNRLGTSTAGLTADKVNLRNKTNIIIIIKYTID